MKVKKDIVLIGLLLLLVCPTCKSQIFGVNYTWIETFTVTTDSVDTTFTDPYYQVAMYFAGCTGLAKWAGTAAGDTVNFAGKPFAELLARQILLVGVATKLKRLKFKSLSGSGTLYLAGYKRKRQY